MSVFSTHFVSLISILAPIPISNGCIDLFAKIILILYPITGNAIVIMKPLMRHYKINRSYITYLSFIPIKDLYFEYSQSVQSMINLQMSECPLNVANCKTESPSKVSGFFSTIYPIKSWQILKCPFLAASCSGVTPLLSPGFFLIIRGLW